MSIAYRIVINQEERRNILILDQQFLRCNILSLDQQFLERAILW